MSDLMEALAEAWDEAENGEETSESERDYAAAGSEAEEQPDRSVSDDSGAENDDGRGDGDELQEGEKSAEPRRTERSADKGPDLSKPPAGLSPEARAEWDRVPQAVKQAIAKREEDFSNGIQKYAAYAKTGQQMVSTLAPFQQLFALNGNDPTGLVSSLLQTASVLQMGNKSQRAQLVANLVKQFDVDISTLDDALVGQMPEPSEDDRLQQAVQQAIAPYHQMLTTYQQREYAEQQRASQEISNELAAFANDPKHIYYEDVRADMADILDMAANRGLQMTLQEAYDRACKINPNVAPLLDTKRKRKAASSISGSPGGDLSGSAPDSMRAAIEAAWDNAGRM